MAALEQEAQLVLPAMSGRSPVFISSHLNDWLAADTRRKAYTTNSDTSVI
jgi:hypothetical protein